MLSSCRGHVTIPKCCDIYMLVTRAACTITGFSTNVFCYESISQPKWIGADSAYKLRTTVMTPFRKNSNQLNASARKDFNRFFSSYRVRVEHTYGIMKEKLPSLKKLPIKINDRRSHQFACDWIRVCCILHNMLLPLYDEEDLQFSSHSEPRTAEQHDDSSEDEDDAAQIKRNALYEVLSEQFILFYF